MPERIRVGLAGTGDIGRIHARALRSCAYVDLAICRGVNPDRAEILRRDFDAIMYPSYDEMLADPAVRAVDICVPNDLHRSYVEKAAAASKHILCEKPIAMTLEDAHAMYEAAQRSRVVFMIAHVLRFWPEYMQAREFLRSGNLGACRAITMRRMLSLLVSVRGEQDWRHSAARMGGAILDLQIHDLDFLNWTFGMPDSVYCAAVHSRDGGLNHCYAVLNYASGMRALVESSYMLQGDPMVFSMKAVCDKGTLDYALNLDEFRMHEMASEQGGRTADRPRASLICYRAGLEPETVAQQDANVLDTVFLREVSHFLDCVLSKTASLVSPPADAIAALRLALACQKSSATGAPVSIW